MGAKARLLIAVLLFLLLVSIGLESNRRSSEGVSSRKSELCHGTERDGSYFRQLVATPDATREFNDALVSEYKASQKTASQSAVEGVMQTIDDIVFCQNAGNFAAVAASFSDQYWISEMNGFPAKADEFAAMAEATASPPTELMEHRSSFSDARVLTDGRVAGFLRWDSRNLDDTQLVAFRLVDAVWLIDEVVFVNEPDLFGTPEISN